MINIDKSKTMELILDELTNQIHNNEDTADFYSSTCREYPGSIDNETGSSKPVEDANLGVASARLTGLRILFDDLKRYILPIDNKGIIELGSIVEISSPEYGHEFYLMLPLGNSISFRQQGIKINTISKESPLAAAMLGKTKGQEFKCGNDTYRIEDIL